MARHRTADEMFPLIEDYLQGHEGRVSFAERHHMALPTFDYWRRKYHNQTDSPNPSAFVEVTRDSAVAAEILFPDGTQVRFLEPVPVHVLTALLHAR